jgi:Protein of unknown function (DUF1778).
MEKEKKAKTKDVYAHIRINSETKAILEEAARKDGRSLSNYLIMAALEKSKK